MALKLLANNNAKSVLLSGVSASATILTVSSGAGSLFPSPVSGESYFKLTITDAATKTISEIVHVTAVSGDVMTVIRGQEGTTARVWSTNDIVANLITAGSLLSFLQIANNLSEIKSAGSSAMAEARSNIGVSDSSGYVGRLVNIQVFNASALYTRTPGATKGFVEVLGAGGGGGGARATDAGYLAGGAGGGAGGYASGFIDLPGTQAVVVGVGGNGGVNTGDATGGGSSSFGSITATGGGPGASSRVAQYASGEIRQQTGGAPGVGSGGSINGYGGAGGNLLLSTSRNSCSGSGGVSHFSGGPLGPVGASGNGHDGLRGSGGSGALSDGSPTTAYTGGNGGGGMVVVYEYA